MSTKRPPNKRKLNPLLVAKLRAESRAFLVWDTQEPGLALKVEPTGTKSFTFVYQHRRRSRWIHIGKANTVSLKQARQEATRLRLEVHQGRDPGAQLRADRGGNTTRTFGTIASRYVDEHAKKKNKSWKQASTLITRYVLPLWAERDASTISRADVRAMLGKIAAPVLHNQVLASTSAVFSWGVRQEALQLNPCKGIQGNATISRERVLSDVEVPLFWNAFSASLKVLLLTGQRPGEVAHMRHEHISPDGWWTMPGAPIPALDWPGTKNAQTHRVYLPAKVRDIIAELGTFASGFVFGDPPALDAAMRDICKALSVPRCTPHDLRRTHGTRITGLGFGREAMNRIQNHKEGGIADVYDRHRYAEENIRIMESVANRLLALAEPTKIISNVVSMHS